MELSIAVLICSFLVSILIGATAIGGLLLVPAVAIIGGIPLHEAIPLCLFAIFFSGIVGTAIFRRNGHVNIKEFAVIAVPAAAGALFGSLLLPYVPTVSIELFITLLCFFAFFNTYKKHRNRVNAVNDTDSDISNIILVCIGAGTGLGSSLSGTGGPLILIPILLTFGFCTKRSIGLAQAIQLPIGGAAAVGNIAIGSINYNVVLPLTIVVIVGAAIGAILAQRTNTETLRPLVSYLLLGCGILYLLQLF